MNAQVFQNRCAQCGRTVKEVIHFGAFAAAVGGPLMDMDTVRVNDIGRVLMLEWKRGVRTDDGTVTITEGLPPVNALRQLTAFASVWLVVYDEPGGVVEENGMRRAVPPNVIGFRRLVGPAQDAGIRPFSTDELTAELHAWNERNSDPAYLASAFARQALALAQRAIAEREKLAPNGPQACDGPMHDLAHVVAGWL